ncbi:MAG TPA: histidine phosphatase family protein [Ktedonobacteraceae bacterium]|nr:histidine phosphatase family protein [Ktedonobacteraceae bacterium]
MPTIFLIRHGESQSNAGWATTDPEKVALTPRGLEQAERIASYLEKSQASLNLIVISRYLRTLQTAQPARRRFPKVPLKVWNVHEFTYLSSMHTERLTTEERRPLVEAYWQQCLPNWKDGPGSESFIDFIKRARKVFKTITVYKGQGPSIAIFSHEQFIKALLWLSKHEQVPIDREAMSNFKEFLDTEPLPNGAIIQIKYCGDWNAGHYTLIREHLGPSTLTGVGMGGKEELVAVKSD